MKTDTHDNPIQDNVDRLASQAHEAVDKVAHVTNDAADNLTRRSHDLKENQEEWMSSVSEYVQDNPLTSIGIAVAGGYLLSRILSGR